MALPQQFGYGLVTGGFQLAVGDRDDADQYPDGVPAEGTVSFRPQASRIIIPGERVVTPKSVECSLDADGYLYLPSSVTPGEDGKVPEADRGVYLVANDTPEATPQDWTYEVTVSLTGQSQWRFPIAVTTDSEQDISTLAPVDSSGGTPIIRGPEGPRGKPGQDGTMASIVAGDGITVDNTDPANPVVSATSGGAQDTGWRDVSSLLAAGLAPSTSFGRCRIRRIGPAVYFDLKVDVSSTGVSGILSGALPTGWTPTPNFPMSNSIFTASSAGSGASGLTAGTHAGVFYSTGSPLRTGSGTPWPNPGTVAWTDSYLTDDPFPTALPGTPA